MAGQLNRAGGRAVRRGRHRNCRRPTASMASSPRVSPYDETEDQQNAIDAVIDDLSLGRPMDRLICGDVPAFGKDGSGAAGGLRGGDGAGCRWRWWCQRRCWRASTSKTFSEPLRGPAGESAAGLAAGRYEGTGRDQEGHHRRDRRHRLSARMRCSAPPLSPSGISAC